MAKKIKIFMALFFFLGGGQFVPLGKTIRQKKKSTEEPCMQDYILYTYCNLIEVAKQNPEIWENNHLSEKKEKRKKRLILNRIIKVDLRTTYVYIKGLA